MTDVLFNLLILEIRRLDGIERITHPGVINSENLTTLESFINDTCHIPFKFFVNKDSKQLTWRDLMGPEKLTFFKEVNLPAQLSDVEKTQGLWRDFFLLYTRLQRKNFSKTEALNKSVLEKMLNSG